MTHNPASTFNLSKNISEERTKVNCLDHNLDIIKSFLVSSGPFMFRSSTSRSLYNGCILVKKYNRSTLSNHKGKQKHFKCCVIRVTLAITELGNIFSPMKEEKFFFLKSHYLNAS